MRSASSANLPKLQSSLQCIREVRAVPRLGSKVVLCLSEDEKPLIIPPASTHSERVAATLARTLRPHNREGHVVPTPHHVLVLCWTLDRLAVPADTAVLDASVGLWPVARSLQAQASPSMLQRSGQLVLANQSADSIRLQVRASSSANCTTTSRPIEHVVPPKRRWAIGTTGVVCWRRADTLHGARTSWGEWQHRSAPARGSHEITF
jgi:hypothetical protein